MVEIREIDLVKNEVTYMDYEKVDFPRFYDAFIAYWNNRIAGETISPFDMERFMKRGSAKNLAQLCKAKKVEGYLEATIGKKMDPAWIKYILIMVVIGAAALIGVYVLKQIGLF
ncbi:hypothetical protein CCP3SC1AL1_3180004 [Gammaproteobacteria bacterium]